MAGARAVTGRLRKVVRVWTPEGRANRMSRKIAWGWGVRGEGQSYNLPVRPLASALTSWARDLPGQRSHSPAQAPTLLRTALLEIRCFLWAVLRPAVQIGSLVGFSRYADGTAVAESPRDSL